MRKGQAVTGIFVMLLIGVVGLVLVSSLTEPFCNCVEDTQNKTLINNTAVDFGCEGDICVVNSLTCNNTKLTRNYLAVVGDYERTDCNITLVNSTWNGTSCELDYTYEGTNYDDGILGVVVCNIPVLFALGLLIISVGWIVL